VPQDPPSFRNRTTALKILRYLIQHPDAHDTLEGIVEWWLLDQHIQEETGKVGQALEELVDHGFVEEHRREGDESEFSVNAAKRDEIVNFVKSHS
jgi:hypothetical protein